MIRDIRLTLGSLLLLASTATAQQTPAAKVAERTEARLAPGADLGGLVVGPGLTHRIGSPRVEHPEAPLTRSDAEPPDVPEQPAKPVRPRASAEPPLIAAWFGTPEPPRAIVMPDGPLSKQPGLNAQATPPLPLIGQYARDRVSLADPSWEASMTMILLPQNPERVELAPFTPFNVPDPFENAMAVRLRETWAENPAPPRFITPPTRP